MLYGTNNYRHSDHTDDGYVRRSTYLPIYISQFYVVGRRWQLVSEYFMYKDDSVTS